jgi:flagellar motility protein MotE (MotC chaperone)
MAVCLLQMEVLVCEMEFKDQSYIADRLMFMREVLGMTRQVEMERKAEEASGTKDAAKGQDKDVKDHDNAGPATDRSSDDLARRLQAMRTQFAQLTQDVAALEEDLKVFKGPMKG